MQTLDPRIHSLLDPFLKQSVRLGSTVALGCGDVLGGENISGLAVDGEASSFDVHNAARADKLGELAAQARERSVSGSGETLFVLPLRMLNAHLPGASGDFAFRAWRFFFPSSPRTTTGGCAEACSIADSSASVPCGSRSAKRCVSWRATPFNPSTRSSSNRVATFRCSALRKEAASRSSSSATRP
jgi:hypothetical protein